MLSIVSGTEMTRCKTSRGEWESRGSGEQGLRERDVQRQLAQLVIEETTNDRLSSLGMLVLCVSTSHCCLSYGAGSLDSSRCAESKIPHRPDRKRHWIASHHANEAAASYLPLACSWLLTSFTWKTLSWPNPEQAQGEVIYVHIPAGSKNFQKREKQVSQKTDAPELCGLLCPQDPRSLLGVHMKLAIGLGASAGRHHSASCSCRVLSG